MILEMPISACACRGPPPMASLKIFIVIVALNTSLKASGNRAPPKASMGLGVVVVVVVLVPKRVVLLVDVLTVVLTVVVDVRVLVLEVVVVDVPVLVLEVVLTVEDVVAVVVVLVVTEVLVTVVLVVLVSVTTSVNWDLLNVSQGAPLYWVSSHGLSNHSGKWLARPASGTPLIVAL
mmetsp:Transcript_4396/g.11944  ORF Transcript_4396/g.11944 Transcript_4396/m.11944 type:complete len:177 (-) Transcript_4396:364-894(-)